MVCQSKSVSTAAAVNYAFSLLGVIFLSSTHAQIPVSGAAFARAGAKLYISGGAVLDNQTYSSYQDQFLALDLSVAWDADKPALTVLQQGPSQVLFSAAFSADKRTMATFHSGGAHFCWLYNTTSNSWGYSSIKVPNPSLQGIFAVTDPTTNLVYLAGGYEAKTLDQMLVYRFDTDSTNTYKLPPSSFVNSLYYRGVWWPQTKSILYFGGYIYPSVNNVSSALTQFTPSTGTWTTVSTSGRAPFPRRDFCMEISEDGSKVVVFGGRVLGRRSLVNSKRLYILDLNTMAWKEGTSSLSPRSSAACTIAGSSFIAWGGQDDGGTASNGAIIYDMNTDKYASQYKPTGAVLNPSSPASNGSTNIGVIIGAIAAGLVVFGLLVGAFFYFKRRRGQKSTPALDNSGQTSAGNYGGKFEEPHLNRNSASGDSGYFAPVVPFPAYAVQQPVFSTGQRQGVSEIAACKYQPPYQPVQTQSDNIIYQCRPSSSPPVPMTRASTDTLGRLQFVPDSYVDCEPHHEVNGPHANVPWEH
ncbi:hypothetical protein KVV02_008686 [Mortierella alpina]|uniref:Kelch repeat protein n=1 Tax=Mortierella alpina TaxID=64518 RepID=A0A9P8CVE3_MORAP|nr:hypothetical protein KVV02_008686 [Mortierella alpina]